MTSIEIFADKGRYLPTDSVVLTIISDDTCGQFEIEIWKLHVCVRLLEIRRTSSRMQIVLDPLNEDFAGYGVICRSNSGLYASCSIDVQKELKVFRYGFLTDFDDSNDCNEDVESLAKHHINAVQFYDWCYRHDSFISPEVHYSDMMGKSNSLDIIQQKIKECHRRGMKTLGYGAVYAASEEFAEDHPSWRLYSCKEIPIRFINIFSIMNLQTSWRQHIINEYLKALQVGFDGIHMDTYGFPKTSYDYNGKTVFLEDGFGELLEEARRSMPHSLLVFNHVGGWPLADLIDKPYSIAYIEVWPPYERFCHLKYLISEAMKSKKPVVLAAYPSAFRTDTPERALNGQLLLMSAIAAHGATQLWFGEENAAITQGYYVDYCRLTRDQEDVLRKYDDFFVRYESLLFDESLTDISMTHFGSENCEYRCDSNATVDGSEGDLWIVLRESPKRKLISLLNISGGADKWADGKNAPSVQNDISLHVQFYGNILSAYSASPDQDHGNAIVCDYSISTSENGEEINITIPSIYRYTLIWIELDEDTK